MGALTSILSLAGTGVQAYGQYRAGQDAKQIYEYNQAIAEYQAKYSQDVAKIEETQLRRDVQRYVGRQRAIAGKSGTVVDSGSNLAMLETTQREADIDAALIRYRGNLESYKAKSQAKLFGTYADQFGAASFINVGSTLLGGASKVDYKKLFKTNSKLLPTRPAGLEGKLFGQRPGA